MKQSIAILLLISMMLPFLGTSLFLHYKKQKIRQEAAELIIAGLDEKDVVMLKFTKKETETRLNWKHSREFEFEGQMYDIIKKHYEGDIICYYCYKDHKETKLNKMIARTASRALGQDPDRKSQNEKIVSFMKSFFRQDAFAWTPFRDQSGIFRFSFFIFHFSSIRLTPPVPPPK